MAHVRGGICDKGGENYSCLFDIRENESRISDKLVSFSPPTYFLSEISQVGGYW